MIKLQAKATIHTPRFKTDTQFPEWNDDCQGRINWLLAHNWQVRIMARDSFGSWYELQTLRNTGRIRG